MIPDPNDPALALRYAERLLRLASVGAGGIRPPREVRAILVLVAEDVRYGMRTIGEAGAMFAAWKPLATQSGDAIRATIWALATTAAVELSVISVSTDGRQEAFPCSI